jgi:glyoxylase I family protein
VNFRIQSLAHASLIVADVERALAFYVGLLGLPVNTSRPELGYPGAWLDVGDQQIHLLQLPNPDPVAGRPQHGGRDRHLAFYVSGLDEVKQTLDKAGIGYTESRSGRAAIFFRDYDGNALEFIER